MTQASPESSPCPSPPGERRRTRLFFQLVSVIYPVIEWNLLPTYRKMLERIGLDPSLEVLDLATGTGILAGAFAERGHPTVGLDFTPALLRRARRRFPGVDFREFDLCGLGTIRDDSSDIVSMGYFLHGADPTFRHFVLSHAARIARHAVVVFDYGPEGNWFVRVIEWVERSHYPEFIRTPRHEEFGRAGLGIVVDHRTSQFGHVWVCRPSESQSTGDSLTPSSPSP